MNLVLASCMRSLRVFWLVLVSLVFLDQGINALVWQYGRPCQLYTEGFCFTTNLTGLGGWFVSAHILLLVGIIFVFLFFYCRKLFAHFFCMEFIFGLIAGLLVSRSLDLLLRGVVLDYMYVFLRQERLITFNLVDVLILVLIGCTIVVTFSALRKRSSLGRAIRKHDARIIARITGRTRKRKD